jgi:hypothetical protein
LPILGNVSFELEEYAMTEVRELTTTELDAVSGGWGFTNGSFNGNFAINVQGVNGSGNGSGFVSISQNNNNNFHELF